MKIEILNKRFEVIDAKEKVTIADSFVVRQNKIGFGNGEAKLYVGNENKEIRKFFGTLGFSLDCFLLKADLIKYLEETKAEYLEPQQPYIHKSTLQSIWEVRRKKIELLPDKIDFIVEEQTQIIGPRIYVKSNNKFYKLIRELSLSNITYISIVKLLNESGKIEYYFRLFADYFGDVDHPYTIRIAKKEVDNIEDIEEKEVVSSARIGQGKYRIALLNLSPICPITLVTDDRLLIASHIKPWIKSNDFEKTDPLNGFMLTPTFDFLFDRGFMSFTDDKRVILSPFLSKVTYSKIGISDNKTYPHLPTEGREKYLEYHRNNILKR